MNKPPYPVFVKPPARGWKYTLAEAWTFGDSKGRLAVKKNYTFSTKKNGTLTPWLMVTAVDDGVEVITVCKGYSSDGCTIVPDCKEALPGCILHDALYQAARKDPNCPWKNNRKACDLLFRDAMAVYGFNLFPRSLYYLGVRIMGRAFYYRSSKYKANQ